MKKKISIVTIRSFLFEKYYKKNRLFRINLNSIVFVRLFIVFGIQSLNLGRNQITHTISRHLALIISKTEDEFQVNYTNMKNLYGIRSSITHGTSKSKNLEEDILDLQNKVRAAINYCLALNIDKAQLFKKLNSTGFTENLKH